MGLSKQGGARGPEEGLRQTLPVPGLRLPLLVTGEEELSSVGGGTTRVPRPCQHQPFRLWVGEPEERRSSCGHQGGLEGLGGKHRCGHHLYRSFRASVQWELSPCMWVSRPQLRSPSSHLVCFLDTKS